MSDKTHASLQIMVRTSVQFEKNLNKTVGGVVQSFTERNPILLW